jgi:peptide deformylase|tara:strand:- start:1361 stop:1858 length:498 start_codon:yes stop_codon:yes gene_type:complete
VNSLKLIRYSDPKLKRASSPVRKQTNWMEVRQLVDRMFKTMYMYRGFGLSAPQVGVALQIIVIDDQAGQKHTMINPKILSSEGKIEVEESNVTFPGVSGYTERDDKIVVSYLDYEGNPRRLQVNGAASAAIQQQIDHLNGILFTERMSRLHSEKIKKKMKKKYGD